MSQTVIWKYPCEFGQFTIALPEGADILTVQVDRRMRFKLWARVDSTKARSETRTLLPHLGRAIRCKGLWIYVGTVQRPPYVWHLFREVTMRDAARAFTGAAVMPSAPLQACPAPALSRADARWLLQGAPGAQEHQRAQLGDAQLVSPGALEAAATTGAGRAVLPVRRLSRRAASRSRCTIACRHQGDRVAFFARANLVALCKACHTARTARGE